MNFSTYDENAGSLIDSYLKDSGYAGSDFSYQTFLRWFDDVEYAEQDDVLFLRAIFNGELCYWRPLIKPGNTKTLKDAVAMLPENSAVAYVTDDVKDLFSEEYVCCTNRDWSEYIYDVNDFITLSGKKYNGKRNHIARFKRQYNYDMRPLKEEDFEEVLALDNKWFDERNFENTYDESAKKEFDIAKDWLRAAVKGELVCDVLRVDGKVVGAAIGERMASGNCVECFEKADTDYEGVYSFLAREFIARNFADCKYLNRQEDMGIEGLRKSKLSYNPAFLLDKYLLTPKSRCAVDRKGDVVRPCDGDSSLSGGISHGDVICGKADSDQSAVNAKIEEIKNAPLSAYEFRRLGLSDFNAAMTFFKCGIRCLDDKKFFMNYTDDELSGVLEKGFMLGAFYDNHLVGTCGFDSDAEFGKKLAAICGETDGRQFYEFSGIMVCRFHRNKGLAHEICGRVVEYARENYKGSTLCATVQYNNVASLKNLNKLGFSEKAEASYKEYTFKYLTLAL